MKKHYVQSLQNGQQIEDVFLAVDRDYRQARNGSNYISLVLADRTGRMNARKWDAARDEFDFWSTSDFLLVRGRVETYKGRLQLIVKSASPVECKGEDVEEFLPRAAAPAETMLADLKTVLGGMKNAYVKALVDSFLDDPEFVARFSKAPAAIKLHHAYISGLLEHTLAMARAAESLCRTYSEVDRDLLLAGVFLHDIGKVRELASVPQLVYTDEGYLLGHISIGAGMASERMDSIPEFDRETKSRILHMILSHHGEHEFGSPVLPMTLEAVFLHYLDNIDAKTRIFLDSASKAREEGQDWSEWLNHLNRRFYVHGAGEPGDGR